MPKLARDEIVLEYLGSLIMVRGEERCLGYLIHREDKGWTYDSDYGRVDVSKEHAEIHNRELTKALLQGLDETCEVGQYGVFYYHEPPRATTATVELTQDDLTAQANLPPAEPTKPVIKTWTGEIVSDDIDITGWGKKQWVTFRRKDRTFKGRKPKPGVELFTFQRVA